MEDAALSNRELAALVVLVLLIAFVLTRPGRDKILSSVRGVLVSLAKPSLITPLLLYIGWIFGAAAGAAQFGLWDSSLLKTTILWLLLSGLALVMSLSDAIEKPGLAVNEGRINSASERESAINLYIPGQLKKFPPKPH